ncbi:hypothetical protein [Mycobacterium attenuatum]|uniref:hypothetical protein n=1 Tax=Mycobacterium attenuatum TaxID=2341086 RepID=UPI0010A969D3|nr:hypothetical protein [Mycobacterium attenuatum]
MSDALDRWQTERAEALDSLDSIHGKITGRKRGRKYDTKGLNRALFVALAAEFQGSVVTYSRTPQFTSRTACRPSQATAEASPLFSTHWSGNEPSRRAGGLIGTAD